MRIRRRSSSESSDEILDERLNPEAPADPQHLNRDHVATLLGTDVIDGTTPSVAPPTQHVTDGSGSREITERRRSRSRHSRHIPPDHDRRHVSARHARSRDNEFEYQRARESRRESRQHTSNRHDGNGRDRERPRRRDHRSRDREQVAKAMASSSPNHGTADLNTQQSHRSSRTATASSRALPRADPMAGEAALDSLVVDVRNRSPRRAMDGSRGNGRSSRSHRGDQRQEHKSRGRHSQLQSAQPTIEEDPGEPRWHQEANGNDEAAGIINQAALATNIAGVSGQARLPKPDQALPGPPEPALQQKPPPEPVRINIQGSYARAIDENDYKVPRGGYFFEHDDRDAQPSGPSRRAWLASQEQRPAPRRDDRAQEARGRWNGGPRDEWRRPDRRQPDQPEDESKATHYRGRSFGASEGIFGGSGSGTGSSRSRERDRWSQGSGRQQSQQSRPHGNDRSASSRYAGDHSRDGLGRGGDSRASHGVHEGISQPTAGNSGGFDSGSWKHDRYEELLKPPVETDNAPAAPTASLANMQPIS